ncbi:MAG: LD-carboxypeptidase [Candidatus Pacebacteria bacterium]|nr:LD-carboxypeptidase [Candidatus Paceibacterota bacterium]
MIKLKKLQKGDRIAILSPSFGAPGVWPHVYELGLERLKNIFELEPVEFKTTRMINASTEERARDLIKAFKDPKIKGVISSIGGNDQVTYIKKLPIKSFVNNPKPFFGFSDNTHFANFLWQQGIPSYYGGGLFTQLAMQGEMDEYTIEHLKYAFFEHGEKEIISSPKYNDIGLNWDNKKTLKQHRIYEKNDNFFWNGKKSAEGITWGGCLESIDDMLRNNTKLPTLKEFENIILMTETSEEIPTSDYVFRVYRALGELGILARIKGLIVGRPKAWEFDKTATQNEKSLYRKEQRNAILKVVRMYNSTIPVVQNLDFGHTDPQISMPYGNKVRIDISSQKVFATF